MRRLFANSGVAQSKGEMDFAAVSVSVPSHEVCTRCPLHNTAPLRAIPYSHANVRTTTMLFMWLSCRVGCART